ncbi:MAG: GNAT family N-acetyltransferase [Candidatus Bathyarchaeota archaeon]|jgi:predicted acetyltransferase
MKITPYRELKLRDELLPLFQHAFWWPFNPQEFEKIVKADPRLQHSPVGYAAIDDNRLVGFVGVMDITTRTLEDSEEKVGGIWGVVTHPAHARRGISKTLMKRSHEHFREEGYKFSLLNTSKSLIAYSIYRKLDYKDVIIYPSVYKVIPDQKKKKTKKTSRKTKLNWNKILEIFAKATKDQTGFVVRSPRYGKMLETRKRVQPRKSIISENGYALLKEEGGNVTIQEIIASTKKGTDKLITQSEENAKKVVIAEAVLDNNLQKNYLSHEFMLLEVSYDLLMSKPLTKASFMEVYGHKFYAAATDYF